MAEGGDGALKRAAAQPAPPQQQQQPAQAPKAKRSRLDELMGGGGEEENPFGAAVLAPAAANPFAAAPVAKRADVEPTAAARPAAAPAAAPAAGAGGDAFTASANEALTFHLVADREAFASRASAGSFHPSYTNQVFGEDEQISGYRGLKVDVWLHSATMCAYIEVKYEEKATLGKRPDDIVKLMQVPFANTLMTDAAAFEEALSQANAAMAAVAQLPSVSKFAGPTVDGKACPSGGVTLVPRKNPMTKLILSRTEPLMMFFIDGASLVEYDERWEVLLLMEGARLAGVCTLYNYYAYPDRHRLRLSQLLVLPPFQRRGYGSKLIEAVNALAAERDALDVTVEDPTEDMQRLRDIADLKRIVSEAHAMERARSTAAVAFASDMPDADPKAKRVLPHKVPKDVAAEARAKLKICPNQVRPRARARPSPTRAPQRVGATADAPMRRRCARTCVRGHALRLVGLADGPYMGGAAAGARRRHRPGGGRPLSRAPQAAPRDRAPRREPQRVRRRGHAEAHRRSAVRGRACRGTGA